MNRIKSLLIVLAIISYCMANISGIVTNNGTTPIPGAIVLLEKGGQTTTTEADGSFKLNTSADIIDKYVKRLQNGLVARISENILTITIADRSIVEVTIFTLKGKMISNIKQILETGTNAIALPQLEPGFYLYVVKSGKSNFILKGINVGRITIDRLAAAQHLSSNQLTKQKLHKEVFNDVIKVTKSGYVNYQLPIGNSDTSGIEITMIPNAGDLTDIDGNVYQSVRIGKQVWTVENLRTTKYNNGEAIPHIAKSYSWDTLSTPGYCFYNNSTNVNELKKWGALYNWYVVNTGNLAPAGWHVPSDEDWTELENYCISNGYNWDGSTIGNKIGKSLATSTDWIASDTFGEVGNDMPSNNSTGFSCIPSGYRYDGGAFLGQNYGGYWWSTTEVDESDAWCHVLNFKREDLSRAAIYKQYGIPVRLLRD